MPNRLSRFARVMLCCILIGCTGEEKPDIKVFDPGLDEYKIIQFISSSGLSPVKVIQSDNNADIMLACRHGATRSQIAEQLGEIHDSQLLLLVALRLLERKGKLYTTAIPILDAEQTGRLREEMEPIAERVIPAIREDAADINSLLKTEVGHLRNAYSVLFAYIIDGMIWTVMEEQGLTEKRRITKETPFWGGETWAIYPPRGFSSGTNTFQEAGLAMSVNWSRPFMGTLRGLWQDLDLLYQFIGEIAEFGKVQDSIALNTFAEFGLVASSGEILVPVIQETASSELYRRCRSMAEHLAQAVTREMDLMGLRERYGFKSDSQAMIIAYHELMMELSDMLEAEGLMSKPRAFADPEQATAADVADLVLLFDTRFD